MEEKEKKPLSGADVDRIVEMGWEDRTPFEAIEEQFGVSEQEVVRIMRREMTPKSFKRWRARVQGRKTKHARKRGGGVDRFRSRMQRTISKNRPSKPK